MCCVGGCGLDAEEEEEAQYNEDTEEIELGGRIREGGCSGGVWYCSFRFSLANRCARVRRIVGIEEEVEEVEEE